MAGGADKSGSSFTLIITRAFPLLLLLIGSLALVSMLFEGWIFGGVSFQQTTLGSPLWYISQLIMDQLWPST